MLLLACLFAHDMNDRWSLVPKSVDPNTCVSCPGEHSIKKVSVQHRRRRPPPLRPLSVKHSMPTEEPFSSPTPWTTVISYSTSQPQHLPLIPLPTPALPTWKNSCNTFIPNPISTANPINTPSYSPKHPSTHAPTVKHSPNYSLKLSVLPPSSFPLRQSYPSTHPEEPPVSYWTLEKV